MDANGDPILAFTGSYIIPAPVAPGMPALLAATDSGVSNSDDITNFDNSSAAKALEFSVPGTIPGDVVSIYSDGTLIGSATAASTTTVLATNGTTALSQRCPFDHCAAELIRCTGPLQRPCPLRY